MVEGRPAVAWKQNSSRSIVRAVAPHLGAAAERARRANATSSFLLGSGPLSLPVPGLCTNLYVAGIFLTVNATTNAAGTAFMPSLSVPYAPGFVGAQLHGQGASVDPGQNGLPIALTHGASVTIAPMPVLYAIFRLYASDVAATTGVTDPSANYGLATRVTH